MRGIIGTYLWGGFRKEVHSTPAVVGSKHPHSATTRSSQNDLLTRTAASTDVRAVGHNENQPHND